LWTSKDNVLWRILSSSCPVTGKVGVVVEWKRNLMAHGEAREEK